MTTTLVDGNAFASVVVPADTEPADAASVAAPFQVLTDRTRYLLRHIRLFAYRNWRTFTSNTSSNLNFVTVGSPSAAYLYVAVGASGAIVTSPDGETWTSRTSGTANDLYGVAWSATNSLFVAVGNTGTILTSPDGVTWTSRTSGTSNALYAAVEMSTTLVAVGAAGTILSSTNGTSWTSRTSGTSNALYCVSTNGTAFVAAGQSGTLCYSTNGTTWLNPTSGTSAHLHSVDVVFGGFAFVVGGSSGAIITSTNGYPTWTVQTAIPAASTILSIQHTSGGDIIATDGTKVYVSPDVTSGWDSAALPYGLSWNALYVTLDNLALTGFGTGGKLGRSLYPV